MAEPFVRPTKESMQKVIDTYGDPIVFWAVNQVLKNIGEEHEDTYSVHMAKEWCRLTRIMILNFPLMLLIKKTMDIAEEVAEQQWNDLQVERLKTNKKQIDPALEKMKGVIQITKAAEYYGLEIKRGRSKCPFHKGSNKTSLSLNNEKNVFCCFSCGAKGDIVTFVRKMEEIKNGDKS